MKLLLPLSILLLMVACRHPLPEVIPDKTFESQETSLLNEIRYQHRGSILANGQILITGGANDGYSHEIYDPATNDWAATENSIFSHESHGQITLPDGSVLVVGGYQRQPLNSDGGGGYKRIDDKSEIYDPQANTWTSIPEMLTKRSEFSMHLLPNGSVLVVGGYYLDESGSRPRSLLSSTTEIYDPQTEEWRMGASTNHPHGAHEAIELRDGRILILGGNVNDFQCEIYDPNSGQWTTISRLAEGFGYSHRAVQIDDDRILLTGGVYEHVEGNQNAAIYSLSADSWTMVAPMIEPRHSHDLVLLSNGKILAIGGRGLLNNHPFYPTVDPVSSCEVYDPQTDTWELVGDLKFPRSDHLSFPIGNDRILIVGGNHLTTEVVEIEW